VRLSVRSSSRSASGWVCSVVFASRAAAVSFSRRWASKVGVPCLVFRRPAGFAVSVPCRCPGVSSAGVASRSVVQSQVGRVSQQFLRWFGGVSVSPAVALRSLPLFGCPL
jgi:hypothetical protein